MERSRSKPDIFRELASRIDLLRKLIDALKTADRSIPDWLVIGSTDNPAFQGTWVNFGSPDQSAAFWRDSAGIVRLRGKIKTGTLNTTAFTLPVGFRPAGNLYYPCVSNGAFGYIKVEADGDVIPVAGSNLSVNLDSVQFRAEA